MEEHIEGSKHTLIIVAILCAALLGLAVAYAALSAALNVTFGKVSQNSLIWSVGFESGSISGTKTGSNDTVCGTATATASTVSLNDTVLAMINDKCVYKLKIKNTGTVGAYLSLIAAKTPTSITCTNSTTSKMICGNITYKLTTDEAGESLLTTGNTLIASTGSLDVYFTAEYTGTEPNSGNEQSGGGFTVNYSQQ